MKRSVNAILSQIGYEIRRIQIREESPGFVLHRYLNSDGSFDYEKYRKIQEDGNKRKINKVWVNEENVAFLSNYIKSLIPSPQFGICHGTRRGKEQEWFRKYLSCEVIGTEISDTAENFPYTIQWDFHEVKPELSPYVAGHDGMMLLVTAATGKAVKVAYLQHQMIAAYKAAGLTGVTTHGLRYTAATRQRELGCDWETVASITGHRTAEMARKYMRKRRNAEVAITRIDDARNALATASEKPSEKPE